MKPVLLSFAAVLACDGQTPTQDEVSADEFQSEVMHSSTGMPDH